MKAKHTALHTQIMKTIKENLARTFDDKTSKDVLLSGDTVLQVAWKQKRSESDSHACGGCASSSSTALPEEVTVNVKYFAMVAWPNFPGSQ